MLKFLHTADIHLDSPLRSLALRDENLRQELRSATRAAFARLIDCALEEEVSAVLLAGDLFDRQNRSAKTLVFVNNQFKRLSEQNIPVYYIKGNHDAENPLLNDVRLPENVHIFSPRGESFKLARQAPDGRDIYLHGVSFSGKTAPSLLRKYPRPIENAVNIGLMHTSLNGGQDDAYAPCPAAALGAFGYNYWALGHIHKRAVCAEGKSLIVMPGCPQGRDIGEDGAKSATMLLLGADGILRAEERPSAEVIFARLSVSAAGIGEEAALRRKIAEQAGALAKRCAAKMIARLKLSGATPLHWQIIRNADYWRQAAAEDLAQSGIWLEKLEFALKEEAEALHAADAIADLPLAAVAAEMPQAALLSRMRAVIDVLPPAARAALCPGEAAEKALLQSLLRSGQEKIRALMREEAE